MESHAGFGLDCRRHCFGETPTVNGQGADYDTLVASARAYVNALNKLLVKREKTAPTAIPA